MTITQLEYVLMLAKTLNFAKAAKNLGITQPTLSMQLKKLEEELQVVIFDRSKNPIVATQIGEKIVEQARIINFEFKKIGNIVKDDIELRGEFKIGIIPSIAPNLIPLFLKKFTDQHPKLELVIEEIQTQEIIDRLQKDEIDVGILATPLHYPNIVERVLYYEPFLVVLNAKHELLKRSEIDVKDLDLENIWLMDQGHCLRNQIIKLCSIKKNKSRINFKSSSLETIKTLILKGQGLSILPKLALNNIPGHLIRALKSDKKPAREIALVYSRNFLKEKEIDALEKCILDSIPDELESPKKGTMKIISPE